MEITFLEKLANEIHRRHPLDFDNVCLVFPSKRSGLFFKKELAKLKGKSFWAPQIVTIDSFIEEISGVKIIDPLEQLFELYEVHKELKIQPQLSFDKFIDVGKIVLADFNDIDMALVDAFSLFENVKDYVQLEKWDVEKSGDEKLTEQYLKSFADLPRYYQAYQNRLLDANKSYQGLIYRYLNEQVHKGNTDKLEENINAWDSVYIAGLNALTPAENFLFEWLGEHKTVEIFFEAEKQMITDPDQESGTFIREFYRKNKEGFKWSMDHITNSKKNINTYSLNGHIGMARMVGELFETDKSLTTNNDTAIILADEGLLMPVLESLPPTVGDVNVTLGFPLGLTTFMSFTEQLFTMHRLVTVRHNQRHFYYKDVLKVLMNPVIMSMYANGDHFDNLIKKLVKLNLVWIEESVLISYFSNNDDLSKLGGAFTNWNAKPMSSVQFFNFCLNTYQNRLEDEKRNDDVIIEQMYFFKTSLIKLMGYLNQFSNDMSLEGIRKIFKHVVSKIQVPFSGEPLAGVQIMGLLETRMLSFKNVVFVSVNEGIIPSKAGYQSFLPFALRNGFKIQTHNDRESIFAYHFYRILSQATNIHLIYDSSTNGVGSNEKSRFIRQIEYEWPEWSKEIKFSNKIGIFKDEDEMISDRIHKSPDVLKNIKNYLTTRGLSPSALNTYVESPVDFYYGNVLGVQPPKIVEEDMEHNTFGSIVHECLEEFYTPFEKQVLSANRLKEAYQDIDTIIAHQFSKVIANYKRGKHYLSYYSVAKYVKRFIELEIDFFDKNIIPVTLLANELSLSTTMNIDNEVVMCKGKVDRIETRQGIPYVIDYKSGNVDARDLVINDFDELSSKKYKPKFIQLMMYAWLASKELNSTTVVSGIYTLRGRKLDLLKAKLNNTDELGERELEEFEDFLNEKISEMLNPEIPLLRNEEYTFGVF